MIEIPRALARQFRAVLRRSLMEGRNDWPLVLCRTEENGLVLESQQGDVAVRYQHEGKHEQAAIAFRASVLADCEGRTDELVSLEQVAFGKGRARWTDGGVPRVLDFETVTPESAPAFPTVPKRFTAQPAELLHAFDEAARTTAQQAGRLALSRIQVRGQNGELVATDGRQMLIQRGFDFPWSENLLVPRVLAFGLRDLFADGSAVGISRTDSHVVVRVGPWIFALTIDSSSRFPDVEAVIPRPNALKSKLRFSPEDAAFLASLLPKLPGRDGQHEPITLELGQPPAVRARADSDTPATEVILAHSTAFGAPALLCTDRRFLYRSLKLGFLEIQVGSADKPLVCREEQRLYVWMALEKSNAIRPGPDMVRLSSAESKPVSLKTPPEPIPSERRKTPMPTPSSRDHAPENGDTGTPDNGVSLADLIDEAEKLRAALGDACTRSSRLIAALKHQRRRSRALESAVATLRQLRLDR